MIIPFEKIFYSAFCLLPAAIVSGFTIALENLGRLKAKEEIENTARFPLFKLFKAMHPKSSWNAILFSLHLTKFLYYLIFGFVTFYFIFAYESTGTPLAIDPSKLSFYVSSLLEIVFVLSISLGLELVLTLCIERRAELSLRLLSLLASLFIIPCLPFLFFYYGLKKVFSKPVKAQTSKPLFKLQDKILDYLGESELGNYLDKTEKKLIHTVISFKDRIVREVMVPRISVFSLPSDTSIWEAAKHFGAEGYSRIPVYKESVDRIIGVLLYKDILQIYTKYIENKESAEMLHKTVEHIVKPVLYTPETKKIALLLQEFRSKQIHLAIVVDEYGGTEGIVTIEDILEELVGNIEDEYDTQEEKHFFALSSGGWIVDAKMSILDLEENTGIRIPLNPEYDTIGGYIFHRAGSIPSKGWKIHLDNVDLEVIRSDERSIQRIKLTEQKSKK